jgi:hypothetical protein
MSTIKIEHVDPRNSARISFDVMGERNTDPKLGPVDAAPLPRTDGRKVVDHGLVTRSTFTLERFGDFHLMDLAGGVMIHEVSQVEMDERAEEARLKAEAEAAVIKAAADKEEAEKAKKAEADKAARMKKAQSDAAAAAKPASAPTPTPPAAKPMTQTAFPAADHTG